MKKINFISVLSPEQQRELSYWFYGTIVLMGIILLAHCYFIFPQIWAYYSLKKNISLMQRKINNDIPMCQKKEELKKEYDQIYSYEKKISLCLNHPKNPLSFIKVVLQNVQNNIELERVNYTKNEGELTLICSSFQEIESYIQHLLTADVMNNVRLISVLPLQESNRLRCIVKLNSSI